MMSGREAIRVEGRSYWCFYDGDFQAVCNRTNDRARWARVIWNEPLVQREADHP
jgi:hypothetical protein